MPTKTTRQGVRDLGGNRRVRQPQVVVGCDHLWVREKGFDCTAIDFDLPEEYWVDRCTLCHEEVREY